MITIEFPLGFTGPGRFDTDDEATAIRQLIGKWGCESLAEWAHGYGLTKEEALAQMTIKPCPECVGTNNMMPAIEAYETARTLLEFQAHVEKLLVKTKDHTARIAGFDANGQPAIDCDFYALGAIASLEHALKDASRYLQRAGEVFISNRNEDLDVMMARLRARAYPA